MSEKVSNSDFKVGRARGNFSALDAGGYSVKAGSVVTPEGLVAVQLWRPKDDERNAELHLLTVYEGREYRRVMFHDATERGMTTLAARFMREVAHAH